ncbi:MAG: formyltransferase family protein [Rickettsiales bacterium]
MKVQLLVDNPNSWMLPYAQNINDELNKSNINCSLILSNDKVEQGDILILLSCEKIFRDYSKNKHNLVIHESNLPQGKGWSPMTWQILEGKNNVTITIFEADDKIDSGEIYFQENVVLTGLELIDEIREKQAKVTYSLIKKFISAYPDIKSEHQEGEESYYKKRTPEDSRLDIDKTIDQQFNLLRIVDNDRYPAYFVKNGTKYKIKIFKA